MGRLRERERVPESHPGGSLNFMGHFFWFSFGQSFWFAWFTVHIWASLVAQTAKRLSTMRETWVQSLGSEDSLEKEMAKKKRKWQLTPVLLPRKSHGWRSLVQATVHAKSRKKSDTTD